MASTNHATILIPDISGFTEFITTTELNHGSHAINLLIDSMINIVGDEYEVSEIEGDAVLLIRKGPAPTKQEILKTCVNIFNAFHSQRKWMQQHAICPCGACLAIVDLTLKFVVHHGPLAEIKVGRFVKQSGPDMVVAHRLLKNSIGNNEYLLITEKLLELSNEPAESSEEIPLQWSRASEEYASIGKIDYHFALLGDARKNVPDPPPTESYSIDVPTEFQETAIAASFRDVYMVIMDIPGRTEWVDGLVSVEQDMPGVFIGSIHRCKFKNFDVIISPRRMISSPQEIMYAESWSIDSMNLQLIFEFVFTKAVDGCAFACRILNAGTNAITAEQNDLLDSQLQQISGQLKYRCENMVASFFEPSFQKN